MRYALHCQVCGWNVAPPENQDDKLINAINVHLGTCRGDIVVREWERCPIVVIVSAEPYQCTLGLDHDDQDHEINLEEIDGTRKKLNLVQGTKGP